MEIRWLAQGDAGQVVAAGHLFDDPPRSEWAERFLTQPGHHLAIASIEGNAAGFVSGVEMTHPDKGTEMFLYELGVDETARGRGLGRALVEALAARARHRGCYGMWVLTDVDNDAALATYRAGGATEQTDHVMVAWHFE